MRHGLLWVVSFAALTLARGGPPFVTDDPVPVDYQHWEIYLASQYQHSSDGAAGALPQIEINYGALPNLQLHVIAPYAFDAPSASPRHFGYGDTELGAKYRLVDERESRPQVAVFPLVELPTGDAARGLGSGHTQLFLPLWLQKSFGPWTTYGGAGYWIHPGPGNRNWWLTGWLVQRQLQPNLAVGVEIFHETAQTEGGASDTRMNAGFTWDLNDTCHVLASAGPVLQGPGGYQAYFAIQLILGPAGTGVGK